MISLDITLLKNIEKIHIEYVENHIVPNIEDILKSDKYADVKMCKNDKIFLKNF